MFPRDLRHAMVLAVIGIGWVVLGIVAWLTVLLMGWLGLGIFGVVMALIATRAELGEEVPDTFIRHTAREFRRGPPEAADARRTERTEFQRWAAAARAVGIALAVVGAVMFVRHQL